MKTWLCRKNAPSYPTIVVFLPVWQGNVLTITTTIKYEVSFPSNFGQGYIITIIIESENFFPSYFDQVSLPTPRSPFVSTPPFSVPSNISGRPRCPVIVCLFSARIFEEEKFFFIISARQVILTMSLTLGKKNCRKRKNTSNSDDADHDIAIILGKRFPEKEETSDCQSICQLVWGRKYWEMSRSSGPA